MPLPIAYLPPAISENAIHSLLTSIGFPIPAEITTLSLAADYHRVYRLSYPTMCPFGGHLEENPFVSRTSIVLRVSGKHFDGIKTRNECAVLNWVRRNTSIPVPKALHHDSTTQNPIGHEYIIMTLIEGQTFDTVYKSLSPEHIDKVLDQLLSIISELSSHASWPQISGLQETTNPTTGEVEIVPGPMVDETMWQCTEIEQYWGSNESFESLNAVGPFQSYTEMITARVRKYMHMITVHPLLSSMQSHLPKTGAFLDALEKHKEELNNTTYHLFHRDLHFANFLYDVDSMKITGVIDWEFAAIVPAQLWNQNQAFLSNCVEGKEDEKEKSELLGRMRKRADELGMGYFEGVKWQGRRQAAMQRVERYLRYLCICFSMAKWDWVVDDWVRLMGDNMDVVIGT